MKKTLLTAFILAGCLSAFAQETATGRAVVTVDTKGAEGAVTVPQQSINFYENRKLQQVSAWTALRGERGALQLVVLLDDSSRGNVSLQWNDLRAFLMALPPTAQVAIGYMRNGTPNLVQGFTSDHAAAGKALRLPVGSAGISGSPYFCLSDLVKHWPNGEGPNGRGVRREVIMVSNGVDRYSGRRFDPEDPYVSSAVKDAQRAGVIIYSIYFRGSDHFDHGIVDDGGQNYLTLVSQQTGGQVYLEGFGNPVSFAPFLSDIQEKLENQYELTFVSSAKPGLVNIRVKSNLPNTTLKFPAMVQTGTGGYPQAQ